MDTQDTINRLDRWIDTGSFATVAAKALADTLRSHVNVADPDATQDVFPEGLHAEVISLMFKGATPEIRAAAVALIRSITESM